ncbi:hypothetical protein [Actinoplanes sp. NPDC051494]|uniref:hypothetical protein n=1 Tax=Actinoplanes sp. NPDC051494 TaxID=3363907 RepID=UPI0037AE0A9E
MAEPRRRRWWWPAVAAVLVVAVGVVGVLLVVLRGGEDSRTVRLEVSSPGGGELKMLMYGTDISGATVLGDSRDLVEAGVMDGWLGEESVALPWSQEITVEPDARKIILSGIAAAPGTGDFRCRVLVGGKVVEEETFNLGIDCSVPVARVLPD